MSSTLRGTIVLCSCLRKRRQFLNSDQLWLCAPAQACAYACTCLCTKDFSIPAWAECGTTRHKDDFVCRRHSQCLSGLCVQMPFHMHALFWLCLRPQSQSFGLWGFSSEACSRIELTTFHFPTEKTCGKSCCSCSVEASVLNYIWSWSAGGRRYRVTFDRFKTLAPPLIRFPDPPSLFCFHLCNCTALCCLVCRFHILQNFDLTKIFLRPVRNIYPFVLWRAPFFSLWSVN